MNEINGKARGNKSVCIRVNLTPYQNKVIEGTMQLQGYGCKSKFFRDCALQNSPSLFHQLKILNLKVDRILEIFVGFEVKDGKQKTEMQKIEVWQ